MAEDDTEAPDIGSPRELHVHIGGMHCVNCPGLIESRFRSLPQVRTAKVLYPEGYAHVTVTDPLSVAALQDAVARDGYTVSAAVPGGALPAPRVHSLRDIAEIAGALLVLAALALALQHLHVLPQGFGISDQMSYGVIFLIGLVASVSSCLAVTGGLMVALAAEYNQATAKLSDRQRLAPVIYFNAGRLISYTLLGGVIGAIGSALTLSAPVTGALTLLAAAVMILLGLHMLRIIPSLSTILPGLPRALSERLQTASGKTKPAAFALGALTFFLPCGFTQALQLYVLGKASFTVGALTMLAFALGTLPALVSLSAISSFAQGSFQKHFMRFAGAAVVLLGAMNIQSGLVLSNQGTAPPSAAVAEGKDPALKEITQSAEPQRIAMKVVGLDYQPNQFTVKVGQPVQWWIDGNEAEGCGRVLIAPQLGIRKILSDNSTTLISFTPTRTGEFPFNCSMGMMTPGSKITVTADNKG